MINYIEENVPLTLPEKQLLFQRGQEIYNKVKEQGGFIKVFSQKELPDYLKDKDDYWAKFYTKKIVPYEFQEIRLDGFSLNRPFYCTNDDIVQYYNQQSLAWLKYPVYVYKIHPYSMKMVDNFFSLESLRMNHSDDEVEIMVETSINKMKQTTMLQRMKYKEYLQQLQVVDLKISSVSFSWPPSQIEIKQLKQYLFKSLRPQGSYDGLSYLKNEVRGVSTVVVQIHEGGGWKQGNLTNNAVNEIHLNHGPNHCLWIIVDREHVNKLRSLVKTSFGIDILKDKEIWFENPDFFLLKKIPFKYIQQEKGDVLIQSAGNLCWVMATGQLITTSWCQMVMSDETLSAMSERYALLKELQVNPQIPYQNILLDLYIHEGKLDSSTLDNIQKELNQFFDEENQKLKSIDPPTQIGNRNISFCMNCGREIFNYYYQKDQEISCLNCVSKMKDSETLQLSSKYRHDCLHFLLQSLNNNCNQEFCTTYTGKTRCRITKDQIQEGIGKEQEQKQKVKYEQINHTHEIEEEEQKVYTINDKTRNQTRRQTLDQNQAELKRQRIS